MRRHPRFGQGELVVPMSLSDPIADMLTRVRNAQSALKPTVRMAASRIKCAIAGVLQEEGYIEGYSTEDEGGKLCLSIRLKYIDEKKPVISRIKRVSRPGLRVYRGAGDLPRVLGGLGIAIVSTTQGVMSDRQARSKGQGGEVLCIVE